MFLHRLSLTRNRSSDPSSHSKSPLGSPTTTTGVPPPFYQHHSGSRFTEDAVSAVLSSETGSDARSRADSTTSWTRGDTQPSRLQKLRRAPPPPLSRGPPPPPHHAYYHPDQLSVSNSPSEVTESSWTAVSVPIHPPVPEPSKRSISFCPASHPAESFTEYDRLQVRSDESPSLVLLRAAAPEKSRHCGELLHTSLPATRDAMRDIIPQKNGFVDTVVEAYNNHRGLIVRPDDVWLAIISQFSFFVNGHAEALRRVFVAHDGKRELIVSSGGNRYAMDTASMVVRMTALMEAEIVDPLLREWIMPDFTTTTPIDKTTCAIVMMGAMKNYFAYKFTLRCGIPKVTLEGERKDWQTILDRLEHLKRYGIQTIAWYHLLRPVLSRFVAAYDDPDREANLDFWNKIVHRDAGSGLRWLSGWITAFCVFDERGQWKGNTLNEERVREHEPKKLLRPADPLQLTPARFAAVYTVRERGAPPPFLALDGFPYPTIDSEDVPCGYVCVDVTLEDRGELIETMLIAGSVGAQICSSEKTELFRNGLRDTVRPISAWWYFIKQRVIEEEDEERAEAWGGGEEEEEYTESDG